MRVATLLFFASGFFWRDAQSSAFQKATGNFMAVPRAASQNARNYQQDAIRLRLIARITLPVGIGSIVMSPNGRELYGSSPTHFICVIDLERRKVVSSVPVAPSS